jgi:hypothetical protein
VKLTIDGTEYRLPKLGTWTYDEADIAFRVSGLRAGQVWGELLEGNPRAHLAFAVVAFVRAHPDKDPIQLILSENGEQRNIDSHVVDLLAAGIGDKPDDEAEPEAGDGPPAEGGEDAAVAAEKQTATP